ncbi:MAG: recombinase family protein [Bacillota bacterium]
MTKIGYARVSTSDQFMDLQIDSLKSSGCDRIFEEKVSGKKSDRPELARCLEYLRSGDTLVIWKLDRLGRTTKQLIELSHDLKERGISLQIRPEYLKQSYIKFSSTKTLESEILLTGSWNFSDPFFNRTPLPTAMGVMDPSRKDEYGVPKIQVHYSYSETDKQVIRQTIQGVKHVSSIVGLL